MINKYIIQNSLQRHRGSVENWLSVLEATSNNNEIYDIRELINYGCEGLHEDKIINVKLRRSSNIFKPPSEKFECKSCLCCINLFNDYVKLLIEIFNIINIENAYIKYKYNKVECLKTSLYKTIYKPVGEIIELSLMDVAKELNMNDFVKFLDSKKTI